MRTGNNVTNMQDAAIECDRQNRPVHWFPYNNIDYYYAEKRLANLKVVIGSRVQEMQPA